MMKYPASSRATDGGQESAKAESGRERLVELIAELLASVHGGTCPPYSCVKTGGCRPGHGPVQD